MERGMFDDWFGGFAGDNSGNQYHKSDPAAARADYAKTIEPEVERNFGENWNEDVFCPAGSYAYGFSQKNDKACHGGGACSGQLGLQLFCSNKADKKRQIGRAKSELESIFLDSDCNWRADHNCDNSFVNGVQLVSMVNQGIVDDHGVMATNMMCDNSKALSGSDYKRKSGERTNGFSYCGAGQAVCGFAGAGSRETHEAFDDWGITKFKFYCCTV